MLTRAGLRRWTAVALLAATCSAGGQTTRPAGVLAELFGQDDPADQQRIQAVLAKCGNDLARIRSLIAADVSYRQFAPGWQRRLTAVTDEETEYEVEFWLRVPRGYTPTKSYPLILAAHGQRGSGRRIGIMMDYLLRAAAEQYNWNF